MHELLVVFPASLTNQEYSHVATSLWVRFDLSLSSSLYWHYSKSVDVDSGISYARWDLGLSLYACVPPCEVYVVRNSDLARHACTCTWLWFQFSCTATVSLGFITLVSCFFSSSFHMSSNWWLCSKPSQWLAATRQWVMGKEVSRNMQSCCSDANNDRACSCISWHADWHVAVLWAWPTVPVQRVLWFCGVKLQTLVARLSGHTRSC